MTTKAIPQCLLVNKEIYITSIRALSVFMESTLDLYEQVRTSQYQIEYKNLILTILDEQLNAATQISQGFEASLESGLEPDSFKAIN